VLNGKHILVGLSGGIAAYKVPELIRLYRKAGADVRVVFTRHALEFVTSLTLRTLSGYEVYSDVFAAINHHSTEHISLPDWADVMVVAPATANVLGKMANGIADDALTTTFAAIRKPVVIAPAMNDKMYLNPATQRAMNMLAEQDNICLLDCAEGELACGSTGRGRMQEPPQLVEATRVALTDQTMRGRQVMLTIGPTQEPIDPVRYITNRSTGKMGYALARECVRRGAHVTAVAGPCTAPWTDIPEYYRPERYGRMQTVAVQSAREMYEAAVEAYRKADLGILSAAVADFTPTLQATQKIKKQPGQDGLMLQLSTTHDIAAALGRMKQAGQQLVGFALETEHELEHALQKMERKNLDMIVLNSLNDAGAGFGYDTNRVTLLHRGGEKESLPLMTKEETAIAILDVLS